MNGLKKEISKKGIPTYKWDNKYIYSSYDPVAEAVKFIASQKDLKKIVITCCGADYVNIELLKKKDIKFILSFDPLSFENISSDIRLIRIKKIKEIENFLLANQIEGKEISLLIWNPLIEIKSDIYLPELKKISEILRKASISSASANISGFIEAKNFFLNLNKLESINILKINDNKFENPAAIISSGPSLIDQLDFIKKVKDKCFIFALPSALPYLEAMNITPDYAITVDPNYAAYYHLAKNKNKIKLITTLNINSSIFNIKNYDFLIFNYSNYLENIFFEELNIASSMSEGTVFINLLRLLPQLGFMEAVIFGQDFGFKNGRSHIHEGFFEKEFLYKSNFFETMESGMTKAIFAMEKEIIEINGKSITTNLPLKIYFEHFINEIFDLKLMLPENCFNPLKDSIEKMNISYFINNYKDKNFSKINLPVEKLYDLEKRKKNIYSALSLSGKSKNKDQQKEFFKKTFINFDNEKHFNKINKIFKALK